MSQAYSNPERENDPHALPDIEIFYSSGKKEDFEILQAGWYWWTCFPGCLPDSDPTGPFAAYADALADARNGEYTPDPLDNGDNLGESPDY